MSSGNGSICVTRFIIHFVPFKKSGVKASPTGVKEAHVTTAARYDDKLEPTEN